MSCIGCGHRGLGQGTEESKVDPVTLVAINEAFVHAKDLWEDLLRIFGIGAGRREADAIVPLQNNITNTVLVPAVEMGTNPDEYSCEDFRQMLAAFNSAERQFKAFLTGEEWPDGRAAAQAMWWLTGTEGDSNAGQPYFKIIKTDFLGTMQEKGCGIAGGIITNPDGSTNWSLIAAGAGLLYAVSRKRG